MKLHFVTFGLIALLTAACTANTAQSPVEPSPTVAATDGGAVPETQLESQPDATTTEAGAMLKSGQFQAGEHPTQGTAKLVDRNGQQTIEFDTAFKTDAGPDLVVVLHRSTPVLDGTAAPLNEGDYVVLEPLKSTSGAQTYAIPAGINSAEFQSIVIWCRQFNATFGAAKLS